MEGSAICGLRFSIYYANPKASFYAEPYHLCSYHGVETDLVNLTACVGYEIWRVSTTCTLVLESVKATGIVFLLGVGSFVCYRLYHHYNKRNFTTPPSVPPREVRTTSWVSKKLLNSDSSDEEEEDVHELKGEYFGPADHSDNSSSGRDHGRLAFLPSNSCCSSKFLEEKCSRRSVRNDKMGHAHSSDTPYERVTYNVRTGVDLHVLSPGVGLAALPTSVSGTFPAVVSRLHCPTAVRHGSPPKGPAQMPPQSPSPCSKCLPLRCKKFVAYMRSPADGSTVDWSTVATEVGRSTGCHSDFDGSLSSGESQKCCSDVEDVDGDDEADEESYLLSSSQFCGEEDRRSCSESLKGNFSPGSLLNRHLETLGPWSDRPPPDGKEHVTLVKCLSPLGDIYTLQNDPSVTAEESANLNLEEKDTVNYNDVILALGLESFSSNRLVRDNSFGSEFSEMSVDSTVFNDIGRSTEAKIEQIQREIEDVKKDFLDMESYMGNVDFHGPTPVAFTELMKSPLSDISECSDGLSECGNHGGQSLVDCHRKQRGIVGQDVGFSCRSLDSSMDQVSNSSSQVVNNSVNLSLEWDSLKLETSNSNASIHSKKKVIPGGGQVDSGSDFGTPLTNASPEPSGAKVRSNSVASLEWEEEFDRYSREAEESMQQSFGELPNFAEKSARSVRLCGRQEESRLTTKSSQSRECSSPPCTLAITSDRTMWSSVESGYIDELSESCGSQQVTPLTDESTTLPTTRARMRRPRHLRFKMKDPFVDSAYYDAAEEEEIRSWPVIGHEIKLNDVGSISQNFVVVCENLGISYVRPIYKDGYSAIRAILLQMLSQGYSPLEFSGGVDQVKRKFSKWVRCSHKWLTNWNFARKLKYDPENGLQGMLACLQTLDWLISCVLSSTDKEQSAIDKLNTDPEIEVQAMEAIKMLIMKSVVEMYESFTIDEKVPIFALLLFSRETSQDPQAFLTNHLNLVGDTEGLDDLDLHLLGYTLGITICVLHPGNCQEMITYHPDFNLGKWPEIHLLSDENKQWYCKVPR